MYGRTNKKFLIMVTIFICSLSSIYAVKISRGPYLQLQTDTSMTIVWWTDETTTGVLEWGDEKFVINQYITAIPTLRHEVALSGLKPDKYYFYRISMNDLELTDFLTFKTAPPDNATQFSFTIQGDSRSNPSQCKKVFDAMIPETKNGFCISLGDLPGRGEDNITDYWQSHFFTPANDFLNQNCLYPCIGNHEIYNENSFPNYVYPEKYLLIWTLPTTNSDNEIYYSFDKGNMHFVSLDVYWSSYTAGSEQYQWLEKDLANTNKTWKLVFMHTGPFVSRDSTDTGTKSIRKELVPLFEKYNVDMVCYGHYHIYQRNVVNGITYLVQGAGGASLGNVDDSQPYVQAYAKEFSFTRIDVEGDILRGKTLDVEGKLLDEFEINK